MDADEIVFLSDRANAVVARKPHTLPVHPWRGIELSVRTDGLLRGDPIRGELSHIAGADNLQPAESSALLRPTLFVLDQPLLLSTSLAEFILQLPREYRHLLQVRVNSVERERPGVGSLPARFPG